MGCCTTLGWWSQARAAVIELVDAMEDLVDEMRAVTMRLHTVAQKNEDCRGLAAPLSCEFVVESHVVIFRGNLNRISAKGILNFNVVLRHHRSFRRRLPRYTPVLRHQRSVRRFVPRHPSVHDTVLELLRPDGHSQYAVAANS